MPHELGRREREKPREGCGEKMTSPQFWGGSVVLLSPLHSYSGASELGKLKKPIGSIKIKTKQKQKTTKTNHVSTDSLLCKVIPMSPALRS